jgi:hypothetical protein
VGVSKLDGLAPWRPIEAPTRQPFTSFLHSAARSRVTLPRLLKGALPRAPNALDPSSESGPVSMLRLLRTAAGELAKTPRQMAGARTSQTPLPS